MEKTAFKKLIIKYDGQQFCVRINNFLKFYVQIVLKILRSPEGGDPLQRMIELK